MLLEPIGEHQPHMNKSFPASSPHGAAQYDWRSPHRLGNRYYPDPRTVESSRGARDNHPAHEVRFAARLPTFCSVQTASPSKSSSIRHILSYSIATSLSRSVSALSRKALARLYPSNRSVRLQCVLPRLIRSAL